MLGRRRGRPPHPDVLTPGEWRVLHELRTGATNAEIAIRLRVSITTVKFHIRNIRGKLELDDRDRLAAWRPEPQPTQGSGRRVLAPLGLLLGFWKPAVATGAVLVVGGAAVAAGVLAYAIANSGELPADADLPPRQEDAAETATVPPSVTPQPAATPTADATATPQPTASATPQATATPTATPSERETQGDLPTIRFWGDITLSKQAETGERVADIVEFFDSQYGVTAPGVAIHIGTNWEALADATLETLGQSANVGLAQYRDGNLFVDVEVSDRAIERLYFHAIQDHLAGSQAWGPWWLGEGAAMYAARLFRDWRGRQRSRKRLPTIGGRRATRRLPSVSTKQARQPPRSPSTQPPCRS